MKIDALILDVDGTLWDSTPIVSAAWTRALQEGGINDRIVTADDLKHEFGKPMNVIADDLLPHVSPEIRYSVMDVCCEYEQKALQDDPCQICFPGVLDTIRKLSEKIPVCIVSNCQSGYIELFMEKTGLTDVIKDTECFGDTGLSKAENIRLVSERNGFLHPAYVGDTMGDQEACEEAGVPFIFAEYGFGESSSHAVVISSFSQLLDLI